MEHVEPDIEDLRRRLARAESDLAEVREEFAEFARIVSHDLNAPLRHVASFADLILSKSGGQFDEKTKQYFGFIVQAGQDGQALVKELLTFSRLNTEARPFAPVDCDEVYRAAIERLEEKDLHCGRYIECPALPTISGDRVQLELLFYHLLDNALKFQPQGQRPSVTVTFEDTGEEWTISIADNGIGICDGEENAIFTMLNRGKRSADYPGKGSGLALARTVVRHHGGRIWFDTGVESGAKVSFTLPKLA